MCTRTEWAVSLKQWLLRARTSTRLNWNERVQSAARGRGREGRVRGGWRRRWRWRVTESEVVDPDVVAGVGVRRQSGRHDLGRLAGGLCHHHLLPARRVGVGRVGVDDLVTAVV